MTADDREIVALRHYEKLSNQETATILGISEPKAGLRFLRALKRLKDEMSQTPGLLGEDDKTASPAAPVRFNAVAPTAKTSTPALRKSVP